MDGTVVEYESIRNAEHAQEVSRKLRENLNVLDALAFPSDAGNVHCVLWRTMRMSHDEERVNGTRNRDKRKRAPRHWLNPLVRPTNQMTTDYPLPMRLMCQSKTLLQPRKTKPSIC